jgi:hypothetical protein
MKTLRFFTIVLVAVLLFSTWVPAYAKPVTASSTNSVELAKTKLARLRVTNKTGGTLYVTLSSNVRSYSFATAKQGKTTFNPVIQPGKYNITVRASACGGELHYKRNVKGGTVGLPTFICRRK